VSSNPSQHPKPLNAKQRLFVERYLTHWNASRAAREAGYSEKSAGQIGYQLLQNTSILKEFDVQLVDRQMGAEEVVTRLTEIARGSIADVLSLPSRDLPESEPERREHWGLDLVKAQRTGGIHLIKKIKQTKYGPEVELHDPIAALSLLGKHHALFVERQEVNVASAQPLIREVVIALPGIGDVTPVDG
jgi:phage terminase small subunit